MVQTDEERKAKQNERQRSPEHKAKEKLRRQSPEYKVKEKLRRQSPERKSWKKDYDARPEIKAYQEARRSTPEYKAKQKGYKLKPENIAKAKAIADKPENKAKAKNERDELRLKCLQHYSKIISNSNIPCCNCCGENSYHEFLSLDHIIGKKQMDSIPELVKIGYSSERTSKNLTKWIIHNNFPEGFQVLCHNCNLAKGFYGKCPHEK
mgnify:CR=1 FL=1|jgi:hypothetical protein